MYKMNSMDLPVVVLLGTGGVAHVVALGDDIDDVVSLPQHNCTTIAPFIDPIDVDPVFCATFDPERARLFAEISEGGMFPVTVREHHRNLRHDGHPVRATKWHK